MPRLSAPKPPQTVAHHTAQSGQDDDAAAERGAANAGYGNPTPQGTQVQHGSTGLHGAMGAAVQYLQLRQVTPLEELYKTWDDALADDLLYRRVPLCAQKRMPVTTEGLLSCIERKFSSGVTTGATAYRSTAISENASYFQAALAGLRSKRLAPSWASSPAARSIQPSMDIRCIEKVLVFARQSAAYLLSHRCATTARGVLHR